MTPAPVRLALRRSLREIQFVRAVRPRHAEGVVRDVYRQVERDFGMLAPPVALHSPAPAVLAGSWAILRESLVAAGEASRADKEVVAAAVSAANSCPYCVEVHTMALDSLGRDTGDERTAALAAWAAEDGGHIGDIGAAARTELIATAVTFHYLNRMVNLFLLESPLPPQVPASARPKVRGVLGRVLRPADAAPGDAVDLLPAAVAPAWADLGWAKGNPVIETAFVRATAAVDAAAGAALPPAVRELVLAELAGWDGTAPGLSRSWVDETVAAADLGEAAGPVAKLALLTAKAAYQVDDAVVAAFRSINSADADLVAVTAWASLAAGTSAGARIWANSPAGEDSTPRVKR